MIRRVAEGLGFRALIEHATGSGHSSVDLVLVRGHTKIACEVSVTTSPEHELANLRKCLAEPFSLVALLAEDPNHRSKLRELAAKEFPPEELERVRFLSCDEFVEHLGTIAIGGTKESGEKRVRGYRVKRKFAELSPEERRAVSKQAFCLLAEEMKQPPSLSA